MEGINEALHNFVDELRVFDSNLVIEKLFERKNVGDQYQELDAYDEEIRIVVSTFNQLPVSENIEDLGTSLFNRIVEVSLNMRKLAIYLQEQRNEGNFTNSRLEDKINTLLEKTNKSALQDFLPYAHSLAIMFNLASDYIRYAGLDRAEAVNAQIIDHLKEKDLEGTENYGKFVSLLAVEYRNLSELEEGHNSRLSSLSQKYYTLFKNEYPQLQWKNAQGLYDYYVKHSKRTLVSKPKQKAQNVQTKVLSSNGQPSTWITTFKAFGPFTSTNPIFGQITRVKIYLDQSIVTAIKARSTSAENVDRNPGQIIFSLIENALNDQQDVIENMIKNMNDSSSPISSPITKALAVAALLACTACSFTSEAVKERNAMDIKTYQYDVERVGRATKLTGAYSYVHFGRFHVYGYDHILTNEQIKLDILFNEFAVLPDFIYRPLVRAFFNEPRVSNKLRNHQQLVAKARQLIDVYGRVIYLTEARQKSIDRLIEDSEDFNDSIRHFKDAGFEDAVQMAEQKSTYFDPIATLSVLPSNKFAIISIEDLEAFGDYKRFKRSDNNHFEYTVTKYIVQQTKDIQTQWMDLINKVMHLGYVPSEEEVNALIKDQKIRDTAWKLIAAELKLSLLVDVRSVHMGETAINEAEKYPLQQKMITVGADHANDVVNTIVDRKIHGLTVEQIIERLKARYEERISRLPAIVTPYPSDIDDSRFTIHDSQSNGSSPFSLPQGHESMASARTIRVLGQPYAMLQEVIPGMKFVASVLFIPQDKSLKPSAFLYSNYKTGPPRSAIRYARNVQVASPVRSLAEGGSSPASLSSSPISIDTIERLWELVGIFAPVMAIAVSYMLLTDKKETLRNAALRVGAKERIDMKRKQYIELYGSINIESLTDNEFSERVKREEGEEPFGGNFKKKFIQKIDSVVKHPVDMGMMLISLIGINTFMLFHIPAINFLTAIAGPIYLLTFAPMVFALVSWKLVRKSLEIHAQVHY